MSCFLTTCPTPASVCRPASSRSPTPATLVQTHYSLNSSRNTDLYIVEATDREGELQQDHRNLLTAEEAGHWATQAGARRLMLTHFWPGNSREAAVAAARSTFDGEILTAEEDLVVPLGPT